MTTWYYIRECPLKEQCTEKAWKRAQVYSDTLEGCIEQCARHLTVSSNHDCTKSEAFNIANGQEVLTYEEEEDQEGQQQQAKRQKRSKEEAEGRGLPLAPRDQRLVDRAVEVAIDRVTAAASSSTGVAGHLLVARSIPADMRGKKIPVRTTELQAAIDCAGRALRAVKEAHRISLAASRSFASEAEALGEAVANLESVLQAAMAE